MASFTLFSNILLRSQPTAKVTVAVTAARPAVSARDIFIAACEEVSLDFTTPAFSMSLRWGVFMLGSCGVGLVSRERLEIAIGSEMDAGWGKLRVRFDAQGVETDRLASVAGTPTS
ncbi:hypothetical protein [Sphingobium sp.]|uniref:hypothetical protein n=1 Tax=Sphingobium sp. TaxID=1912891 RepID=UPI002BF8B692|nr:hypothetical protein [Sphingobium sp.]HUD95406.1 hypothetical protein [Sphingobium sp.]